MIDIDTLEQDAVVLVEKLKSLIPIKQNDKIHLANLKKEFTHKTERRMVQKEIKESERHLNNLTAFQKEFQEKFRKIQLDKEELYVKREKAIMNHKVLLEKHPRLLKSLLLHTERERSKIEKELYFLNTTAVTCLRQNEYLPSHRCEV